MKKPVSILKHLVFIWCILFSTTATALRIIGHRGAAGLAFENTLSAFKKAINLGVNMVELDVHRCKTGELVVIHDSTVGRTTNRRGKVADKTLAQLKELTIGKTEKIPTLREVFDTVNRKVCIDIELKGAGTALPTAELIEQYMEQKDWSADDFLISSFNEDALRTFRERCPAVQIALIVGPDPSHLWMFLPFFNPTKQLIESAQKLGAKTLVLHHPLVTLRLVQKMHTHNIDVFAFTVNDSKLIKRISATGLDGIITDYPNRAIKH